VDVGLGGDELDREARGKVEALELLVGCEGFGGADVFGERVAGGATINKLTPLDIIPLYVKAGSILPIGPKVQYAAEKKWDNLEIRVYPGADGEFVLYEDETDNYNYEKGIYSTITFRWNNAKKTLTITDRKGSFPGMLDNRTFRIVLVRANRGIGAGTTENPDKEVDYKGKQVAIRL